MAPNSESSVMASLRLLGSMEQQRISEAKARVADEQAHMATERRARLEAERQAQVEAARTRELEAHVRKLQDTTSVVLASFQERIDGQIESGLARAKHEASLAIEAQRGAHEALRDKALAEFAASARGRWMAWTSVATSLVVGIVSIALSMTASSRVSTAPDVNLVPELVAAHATATENVAKLEAELLQLRSDVAGLRAERAIGSPPVSGAASTLLTRPPVGRPPARPVSSAASPTDCRKCQGIPMCSCGPNER